MLHHSCEITIDKKEQKEEAGVNEYSGYRGDILSNVRKMSDKYLAACRPFERKNIRFQELAHGPSLLKSDNAHDA